MDRFKSRVASSAEKAKLRLTSASSWSLPKQSSSLAPEYV
jgi:hypothetical protein